MNVVRVYFATPIGRRVLFVWHYNSRLKACPLHLAAFCAFDPRLNEYQSMIFCETFEHDLKKECYSFLNHVSSETEFRKACLISQKSFYSLLSTLNLPPYNVDQVEKLF